MRRGRSILTVAAGVAAAAAVAWAATGGSGPDTASDGAAPSSDAPRSASLAPSPGRQDAGNREAGGDTAAARDTSPAARAIRAHRRARRGPEQPIPFNHAFHVTDLQIQCEYCHGGTENQQVATMPQMGVCMGCHSRVGGGLEPIDRMRELWENDRVIRWERVYKVPEFVQFPHRAHLRNDVPCQQCHGPVEEMARIYRYSSLGMGWCLECHRGEPQPSDSATNYRLVRQYEIPEIPEGRQSVGLYPRRIKASYGETRGPVDCASCHY